MANTIWPNMKVLGFLITVFCSPDFGTAQVFDDFSDGDFSLNPTWVGNIDRFQINNTFRLQLYADGTGSSYLSTSSPFLQNCEWQFWIKLGFSPSVNNNCRVYLTSDKFDLSDENLNGYFLQFGESGSNDAIELFRQNGNDIHSICRSPNAIISNSFEMRIKVIRTDNGLWEIFVDQNGEYLFTSLASGFDQEINFSESFGFRCKYTSSNKKKFYFDDVYVGPLIVDNTPPELLSIEIIQDKQLELLFSEPLNLKSVQNLENFIINPGIGNPLLVNADNSLQKLTLIFSVYFEENTTYQLTINNIQDFSGNNIDKNNFDFTYTIARENDIVLNEILFDPLGGCEEYIEIYNRSEKVLNLKNLSFGRIKYAYPNLPDTSLCRISDHSIYIKPYEYWVLSTSPKSVKDCYFTEFPEHFVEVSGLPNLINKEGHLFLVSDLGICIDQAKYSEQFHHPLLNFTDGISLEKKHFNASGLNEKSWQSATKDVGFGTPAFQNSQFSELIDTEKSVVLSPDIFSPDQDGYDDMLSISLTVTGAEASINVFIFNSNGQQVRHLVKNTLIANKGVFYWNGLDEQNNALPAGIYIVLIEVFDLNGGTEKFKKTTVLAHRFN